MMKDSEAKCATVHGVVQRVGHGLVTEQQQQNKHKYMPGFLQYLPFADFTRIYTQTGEFKTTWA